MTKIQRQILASYKTYLTDLGRNEQVASALLAVAESIQRAAVVPNDLSLNTCKQILELFNEEAK